MTKYKILIKDRNYTDWNLTNDETLEEVEPIDQINLQKKINPVQQKLFTKDIFLYDQKTNYIHTVYSHVRSGIPLAGILMLENNKTFGRTLNKKRLLYKCIPDDKQLPAFLIPFDMKIGFSKIQSNKYIIFKFDSWEDQHPHGIILETLGDVNSLDVFYEYQLYCKSLHVSLTDFTKKTREQLHKTSNEEYIQQILSNPDFHIEDRRHPDCANIFTIDPENSLDFDDAFSIEHIDNGNANGNTTYKISVYIANVYFWLETLGLWKSFSSRVSTIYLPDRKRPMLPTILSDNLCSLQEGETRFSFVMDITLIVTDTGVEIKQVEYKNAAIKVYKNYRYEEPALVYKNKDYTTLFDITKKMDKTVTDSHDIVSFWMIKMNSECGKYMAEKEIGIFRMANCANMIDPDFHKETNFLQLTQNTQRIIKMWNNVSGQYILYDKNTIMKHDIMKTQNYSHITSPIRRLVDLLNQIWISRSLKIIEKPSADSADFFHNWLNQMSYLNVSMRSIRKIQTDCEILHRCFNDPHIMQDYHKGILFDKIKKNDGSIVFMVYLEELHLLTRLKTYENLENYSTHQFKLFLFEDESNLKKKIRVQIVSLNIIQ